MNTKGQIGENLSAKYLESKGYKIKEQNYKSRYGEIDIIAENDDFLIFVEVKARNKNLKALPREFVDLKKQNKIIKTALIYLSENNLDKQVRFDIVEVYDYGKENKINHLQNAFTMEAYNETY
jgi:putative endonuclease